MSAKKPRKEKTPAQIGRERGEYVKAFFETSSMPESQVNWLALWVKDEVRKAVRRERGLK